MNEWWIGADIDYRDQQKGRTKNKLPAAAAAPFGQKGAACERKHALREHPSGRVGILDDLTTGISGGCISTDVTLYGAGGDVSKRTRACNRAPKCMYDTERW